MAALDRAEGERDVGARDVAGRFAGRRIHAAGDVHGHDGRAALARRLARADGPRDLAARSAGRAGAEQAVDDDRLAAGACLIQRDDRALAELLDGEGAFGARVGRSRGDGFDDRESALRPRASARAMTHASPPLFPGPAKIRTPASSRFMYRRLISAAAAAPARCMSAREGTPALIVEESRAADSALVTTRTRGRTVR